MNGILVLAIAIGLVTFGLLLKQIYSLKQQCRKAQAKAISLEDEATRLWATQSELSKEAQRLQAEVDRLSEENRKLSQQSNILQSLDATRAKLEQVNATLSQRNSDLNSLEKTLAQRQAALTQLRATGGKLQASYTALRQKYQPLKEQTTSLNRVFQSLQQKIDKLKINYRSIESDRLILEDRCQHLQEEIDSSEERKRSLDAQISSLQENIDHFNTENHRIEEEHLRLLEEHGQYLEAYPDLVRQQEKLHKNIENLEQEKVQLTAQLTAALAQVEWELQGFRRIQIVSACHHHSTIDQELFHARLTLDFSRVREALDFAETMFSNVLDIWDSARVSADASNFMRPDDAYRALQSLAWFGQYYFERNGAIGNTIYYVLKERYNLECTPEAKNVENDRKLRDERCFWNGSQRKEMFDHLKLGGGRGMNNILRIYFAINSESQKIEIGHCGKHLSN